MFVREKEGGRKRGRNFCDERSNERHNARARPSISVPLLRQHTDRLDNSRSPFVQLFTLRTGIPSSVHIRTMPLSPVCVRVAVSSHISRGIRARIYAGQAGMHSKRMRVHTPRCPCVAFVCTHARCWYVCATRGGSAKRATSDRNLDGNCPGKVINRVHQKEREEKRGGRRERKPHGCLNDSDRTVPIGLQFLPIERAYRMEA